MARRATLDRGMPRGREPRGREPRGGEYLDDPAGDDGMDEAPGRPVRAGQWSRARGSAPARQGSVPWRGSGGRWLVWTLRVTAWAVLLVIGYRGVLAIIQGPGSSSSPSPAPAAPSGTAFPETAAEAYAMEFGSAYLNFSPATQARRAAVLASMLPAGADPNAGWNGAGQQTLTSEQVAGIRVRSPHTAVVTLLATINGQDLIELGVPVYASGGRLVVTGVPALLPVPKAAVPPAAAPPAADDTAQAALQHQLPAFFSAYASGQELSRFLVQGSPITGLNGAVSFNNIISVSAPPGGAARNITVVVSWTVNSSSQTTFSGTRKHPSATVNSDTLQMAYDMTVVEQGGTWYVQSIGASSQLPGPP